MTDRQRARRKARYEDARKAYDALMKYYPFTLEDLDGEEWRDVIGYEGLYQESTFGRTKSLKKGRTTILKPGLHRDGYLGVSLCKNGKQKHCQVHRLVAETFIPNIDNKPQVNHVDGHKFNCHVSNLEWATGSENIIHAVNMGLHPSGGDNYQASVTDEQAIQIRLNPEGLSVTELAKVYGVPKTTISAIQLGYTYKNAGGEIRKKQQGGTPRVPDDIREQIYLRYKAGGISLRRLAEEFGYSIRTTFKIIHEQD